jgi:plasmid stabilization system protein ParE
VARQVVWTYPARADLLSALEFIVENSPHFASDFLAQVEATGASLIDFPERGRIVREIPEEERREIYVQKYRLVYRLESDRIVILRFIHGKRDFKTAWKRKPK